MNKIDVGQTISIFANLGVVAGIIFLGIELRQNNDQLAAQITINQHQIRTADVGRFAQDPSLAALILKARKGEQLSEVEREQLYWISAGRFLNWQLNYRLGALRPENVRTIRAALQRDRYLLEFWTEFESSLSRDFVEFMTAEEIGDFEKVE
jgi:hypothetical protein